uniref:Uncharacterized protein n=1 Tax=Arundo donax TaxID=35708 RepID=A0A0A9DHY6_ARUDO
MLDFAQVRISFVVNFATNRCKKNQEKESTRTILKQRTEEISAEKQGTQEM